MKNYVKMTVSLAVLLLMVFVLISFGYTAQAAAGTAAPAAARGFGGAGRGGGMGRGGAANSPEVGADRKVTFRYSAPNAQQVTVSGELDGKSYPMTKGENGVWSVTVGPLPPDIYTYSFNVDGVTALDPRNANTKYAGREL